MDLQPIVSVIVPVYNGERTIKRAVHSVLAQTLPNIEILIVDDGSTDSTWSIISALAKEYASVKIFRSPKNNGVSAARNIAIDAARGEWISLLDADDAFNKQRLEELVREASIRECDVLADNLWVIDENREKTELAFNLTLSHIGGPLSLVEFINLDISTRGHRGIGYCKPIIRRSFLEKNDIRYDEDMEVGEDFKLYFDLIARGAKFCLSGKAYYRFYVSGSASLSSGVRANKKADHAHALLVARCSPMPIAVQNALRHRQDYFKFGFFMYELKQRNVVRSVIAISKVRPSYIFRKIFHRIATMLKHAYFFIF